MEAEYFVRRKRVCSECNGSGVVRRGAWSNLWAEKEVIVMSPTELREWFRDQGYSAIPDEEVPCRKCEGKGFICDDVPLSVAFSDLEEAL